MDGLHRVLLATVAGLLFTLPSLGAAQVAAPPGDDMSVIAPGAKLEKLADGFAFTEGPTADPNGNVFFTDQPNDRILKWTVEGRLETFMKGIEEYVTEVVGEAFRRTPRAPAAAAPGTAAGPGAAG